MTDAASASAVARHPGWVILRGTMAEDTQLTFPSQGAPDPEEQRLHLVALSHVRGLGEASLKALLATYGNLSAVWQQPADALSKVLAGAGLHTARPVVEQIGTARNE